MRVSRHLNTGVFSTLKCRILFHLVMHPRAPLEKTTSAFTRLPLSVLRITFVCFTISASPRAFSHMLHAAYLMHLLNPVFCMCLHCQLSLSSSTSSKLSEHCLAYHWSNSCDDHCHQSFYVLPSILQPCLCPFVYPSWFFLNHSKSSMLSVLQCSFLHPFLALLILLWANSAPHVSPSFTRFASTLRQLPCDHRRKWWLFTRPCLHWYLWIWPLLLTILRSWLTWASRSRCLHDLLHARSVLEVADVCHLALAGCVSHECTLRLVLQGSSGGQQIFSDHAWHDVTPAAPDFFSSAAWPNVFGCSGGCTQRSSSIFLLLAQERRSHVRLALKVSQCSI